MDPIRNPYTPNAGARPPAIVGRDDQLDSFNLLLARLEKGRTEQSMIITGLRGVGKTVLLGAFREKALESGWVTVELKASKHDDTRFSEELFYKFKAALFELSPRKRWGTRIKRAASILSSFGFTVDPSGNLSMSMNIDALEGRGDTQILALDLTEVLVALGEAAQEADRGLVLLVDEIQFLSSHQLEALISAIHKTVQRSLPITMVGAGLPQIAELAGDAKSYAERLFKFLDIGTLSERDSKLALEQPANEEDAEFTATALQTAISTTEGYPYFLQEIGSSIWKVADGSPITPDDVKTAIEQYQEKLDSSFFRVRLDRATPLQAAYLRAMAGLGPGPQSAADVAAVMDRSSQSLGPIRAQLIEMGLLFTPKFGFAQFTVPHFDQFMLRAHPQLNVPEPRSRKAKTTPSNETE